MAKPDSYQLHLRIEVERKSEGIHYTGERLTVSEDVNLAPTSFLEAMAVLGQFHDLAERVRQEQA